MRPKRIFIVSFSLCVFTVITLSNCSSSSPTADNIQSEPTYGDVETEHSDRETTPVKIYSPIELIYEEQECNECYIDSISWSPNNVFAYISADKDFVFTRTLIPDPLHPWGKTFHIPKDIEPKLGIVMRSVDWSPNGEMVAAAGNGGVYIWNADGDNLVSHLESHRAEIVTWSPDSHKLAAIITVKNEKGDYVGRTVVWDTTSWEEIYISEEYENRGYDIELEWSPDGILLAEKINDGNIVTIKHINSGWTIAKLWTESSSDYWFDFAWSPNGNIIALNNMEEIVLWDLWGDCELFSLPRSREENKKGVDLGWSPDGKQLSIFRKPDSSDENINYIRVGEDFYIREISIPTKGGRCTDWTIDGNYLAVSDGESIQVWKFQDKGFVVSESLPINQFCDKPHQQFNSYIDEVYKIQKQVESGEIDGEQVNLEMTELMTNIGKEGLIWIMRRVPVYDSNSERWRMADDYFGELFLDKSINQNSRLAQDPVRTGVNLFFGDFSTDEVYDWFGFHDE